MNYLPFALISYFLNSIALTVDKFLLSKTIPDPLIYIFYFSAVSFLAIFAIPFTHIPTTEVFIQASVSTILWTIGAYLMFIALKLGRIQRVIPVITTLTSLILLLLASQTQAINAKQTTAIVFLISGLIFLTLLDWKGSLTKKELILEFTSAILFAFSYYFLSRAFLKSDFLSVLVWSKLILIPMALLMVIIPSLRKKITPFLKKRSEFKKAAPIFMFGQISAGISELLLTFSISLANPAIVNSLQGIKYVFLLIFSLILEKKYPDIFKNRLNFGMIVCQIIGIACIGTGLYLLAFV